jgi:hypothetical protein
MVFGDVIWYYLCVCRFGSRHVLETKGSVLLLLLLKVGGDVSTFCHL